MKYKDLDSVPFLVILICGAITHLLCEGFLHSTSYNTVAGNLENPGFGEIEKRRQRNLVLVIVALCQDFS